MGCNCGDNEYNITVDNNGNCEPTTPVYNITLANVGVNGYSPIVRFVNETVEGFNIAVDNVTGTETSPVVPKLSYVSDQINNINTTIANLGNTYLTVNGSNANLPFSIGNLRILTSGDVRVNGNLDVTDYLNIPEIRPRNNSGITIGYTDQGNYPINLITNDKAYYNGNEIATVNNIPDASNKLNKDGSNADNSFSINSDYISLGNRDNTSVGIFTASTESFTIYNGYSTALRSYNNIVSVKSPLDNSLQRIATVDQIPTVGNGTITIAQDGVNKGIFTTNQSGNTTINLDSGVTNPLTITDEVSNNFLQFVVNDSGSYIRTGTQGLALNGYLINTVDNPLSLNDVAFGLKAIGLKYDNDTIKVNQDGQLYADVQGGGGSYTAGTGIDITNDTISVDNTVAMKTDIPTNNNQLTNGAGYITATALNGYATETWVGQQGYLTSSDLTNYVTNTSLATTLANYVTNSTLTTTLADYQPSLVSGTNIKTINNTSLLGSGNINVLTNTASSNTSLTIGGTASTTAYSTNVGFGSQATASAAQAFGHYAIASGSYSLALGQGAETSNSYSIQLGKGTNSTAKSLMVGFGTNGNYQLLDGTTGLIPDARISSNIARTSNVADTDLSNLSTTGQAVIDGKVSKSGDTMTGALNLDMTTVGGSNENFQDITFVLDDINRAGLRCSHSTNGTNSVQIIVRNNSGTFASGYEAHNNNGTLSCSFPNTTCVDGQWVKKNATIATGVNTSTTDKTYSLSSYLPNDGYDYEVLFWGYATTAATSGKFSFLSLSTDLIDAVVVAQARTRTSSTVDTAGACILPVGTGRRVVWNASDSSNLSGTFAIYVRGYRRIGTNS